MVLKGAYWNNILKTGKIHTHVHVHNDNVHMYVCINQSLEVHNYIGMLIDVDCWAKLEEQISWANQIIDMHCLDASHRNSFEMTKWNHMHKIHFATPKHRTWNALVPIQLAFVIINFANGNFTYAISTLNWDKWMASVHESHRTSPGWRERWLLYSFSPLSCDGREERSFCEVI